eukprot:129012-Chlamydomonas_euryale.AAC.3
MPALRCSSPRAARSAAAAVHGARRVGGAVSARRGLINLVAGDGCYMQDRPNQGTTCAQARARSRPAAQPIPPTRSRAARRDKFKVQCARGSAQRRAGPRGWRDVFVTLCSQPHSAPLSGSPNCIASLAFKAKTLSLPAMASTATAPVVATRSRVATKPQLHRRLGFSARRVANLDGGECV